MIEEILAYQTADAKLREIEKKLSASEDRKKAVVAKKYLESVDESLTRIEARAAKLLEEFNKMTDDQKALKEQEEEFERLVESVEEETEAEYLLKKLDELNHKVKNLSGKIEKLASEFNVVVKEQSKIKAETRAMQAQYTEFGKKYNEFKASFKAEREVIEKELKELGKKVDAGLMERYLKKRANKIYPVVYEVRGNVCGACNMELSMSEINKLKNGEIVDCDQCGRMLYQGKK